MPNEHILGLPARSRLLLVMHFVIPISSGSIPLIGELGRVVKHENKIVRCRYTLTRGLEMARQNVSFADAMIGKKTVGRLRIRPILANRTEYFALCRCRSAQAMCEISCQAAASP